LDAERNEDSERYVEGMRKLLREGLE